MVALNWPLLFSATPSTLTAMRAPYRFRTNFINAFAGLGWAATLWLGASTARASDADVRLLQQIVDINSGSKNIAGVIAVQKVIERELKKLGFTTSYVANPAGDSQSAPLLLGTLKGLQKNKFVTLIGHADTVFENSSGFLKFSQSADGTQLLGPGVGDDKGGLVIALAGLSQFLAGGKPLPYSLRFVSAPNEEVGSTGFGELYRSYAEDSVMALGFEDALADGALAQSRSAITKYEIKIRGKEAHAGTDHQKGANACIELSMKLVALSRLTDYDRGTTVNVGSISGGTEKTNIVCGAAEAEVEVRSTSPENMKSIMAKVESVLKQTFVRSTVGGIPTTTDFTVKTGRTPFPVNAKSQPFVKKYTELLSQIEGRPITAKQMAGSADISFWAGAQMIAVDDLGAIGGAAHTQQEHILRSSLDSRANAFAEFMNWALPRL